jgi:uncharacterized protein (TIGR02246 family)
VRIRAWTTLPAVLLTAACAAAPEGALETRLAELEAREQIRTVLIDYGRHLDGGDYDAYAGLFTEDGVWTGGFGTFTGRPAIRAMLDQYMPAGSLPSSVHLVSNELIELDGDRATALSKWFFITTSADGRPSLVYAGHYRDELARVDGRWLLTRRVAYGDIPFDDPLADDSP